MGWTKRKKWETQTLEQTHAPSRNATELLMEGLYLLETYHGDRTGLTLRCEKVWTRHWRAG